MGDFDDLLDEVEEEKKSGDSSSGNSSSSSTVETEEYDRSSSASGVPDPYNVEKEGEAVSRDELEMEDAAEDIAKGKSAGAERELDYPAQSGETFDEYIRRQKREFRQLHDTMISGIEEMEEYHGKDVKTFTLALEAVIINMAQMRTGVAEILMEEFGKNTSEAKKIANRLARETDEGKTLEEIVEMLHDRLSGQ